MYNEPCIKNGCYQVSNYIKSAFTIVHLQHVLHI